HERHQIGGHFRRRLALPLLVGDEVVDGSAGNVEATFHQPRHEIDRARRIAQVDLDAVLGEKTLALRDEDRKVDSATKGDDVDRAQCWSWRRLRLGRRTEAHKEENGGQHEQLHGPSSRDSAAHAKVSQRLSRRKLPWAMLLKLHVTGLPRPRLFAAGIWK